MNVTYQDPVLRLRQRLAKEIANWITTQGLTQEAAGVRLNFEQRHVSSIVRGDLQHITAESLLRAWGRIGGEFELLLTMRP